MARKGCIIRGQQANYYLTFTVVGWIDIFTRQGYRDIMIESFKHCQKEKGLHLPADVVMSNHVHLIVSVDEGFTVSDFIRDQGIFKFFIIAMKIILLAFIFIACNERIRYGQKILCPFFAIESQMVRRNALFHQCRQNITNYYDIWRRACRSAWGK